MLHSSVFCVLLFSPPKRSSTDQCKSELARNVVEEGWLENPLPPMVLLPFFGRLLRISEDRAPRGLEKSLCGRRAALLLRSGARIRDLDLSAFLQPRPIVRGRCVMRVVTERIPRSSFKHAKKGSVYETQIVCSRGRHVMANETSTGSREVIFPS